ncbi:uncharacterized protein TM35_000441290, partial [Trypanosoma theileri]
MVPNVKSVYFCAHIAPARLNSEDINVKRSSIQIDPETGDVVLRDDIAGTSRFRFDSVTYYPFHTTLYEAVLGHRVAESFGSDRAYLCDSPPVSMHSAIIHGSSTAHTMELFHTLVLTAVSHAFEVINATNDALPVQLQYSIVRVYSWGLTDVLSQRVVSNSSTGVIAEDSSISYQHNIKRNVIGSREDVHLVENILCSACAVPEGHAAIVFSLFSRPRNSPMKTKKISSGIFSMTLLPQLWQGNRQFQGDMHTLRDLLAGHPLSCESSCWLISQLLPTDVVNSVTLITCICDEPEQHQQTNHSCVYGCSPTTSERESFRLSFTPVTTPQRPKIRHNIFSSLSPERTHRRVISPYALTTPSFPNTTEHITNTTDTMALHQLHTRKDNTFTRHFSPTTRNKAQIELLTARSLATELEGHRSEKNNYTTACNKEIERVITTAAKVKEEAACSQETELEERVREAEEQAKVAEEAARRRIAAAKSK